MRRSFLLSALALILLVGCKSNNTKPAEDGSAVNADNAATAEKKEETYSGPRRYLVKSGIIQYQYSGMQTGTETLYFDDYGMKEAKFTDATMKMMGVEQKRQELSILDGDNQYTIDLTKKTGIKMKNPFLSQALTDSDDEAIIKLGEKMMAEEGGKKIGTETVAGKECDVWEIKKMNAKTWVWKALPLKFEMNGMGMKLGMVATSIQENVDIPAEKLAVPEGIKITEQQAPDVSQMMPKKK